MFWNVTIFFQRFKKAKYILQYGYMCILNWCNYIIPYISLSLTLLWFRENNSS